MKRDDRVQEASTKLGNHATPDQDRRAIQYTMTNAHEYLDAHAQATGGFTGPGSLIDGGVMGGFGFFEAEIQPWGEIERTDENLGSVYVSGKFVRHDGAALPFSAAVFFYIENADHPDDFARGKFEMRGLSGDFSMVVMDIPPGNSRLFLSFVIEDPAEALSVTAEVVPATSVFSLDISNMGCVPSLTITHEWIGGSFASLEVTEPDQAFVNSGRSDVSGVSAGVLLARVRLCG